VFERDGRVYTEIISDCKEATLQAVIKGKVSLESVIYSDGWRGSQTIAFSFHGIVYANPFLLMKKRDAD